MSLFTVTPIENILAPQPGLEPGTYGLTEALGNAFPSCLWSGESGSVGFMLEILSLATQQLRCHFLDDVEQTLKGDLSTAFRPLWATGAPLTLDSCP